MLNRISWSSDLTSVSKANFCVEAVNEDFDLKKKIFKTLADTVPDDCILATNTSSISISKIAGTIPDRAEKVIGMHFMNPVPVMKLVEVIRGL